MSKIGKVPVLIPSGVTVTVEGPSIKAVGKLGTLFFVTNLDSVSVVVNENKSIVVSQIKDDMASHALWGTTRAMINNIVHGVSSGFSKELELRGVGFKASMKGKDLVLNIGFSHEVVHVMPDGIRCEVLSPTEIKISGIDKQQVGQVAAEIRAYRKPEPYKGKGIRYKNEYVRKLEGKKK